MKKIYFLLLFMVTITAVHAQYQSIFGSYSTSWNVVVDNQQELKYTTDSIVAGGDTVIGVDTARAIYFYSIDHETNQAVLTDTGYVQEDLNSGKATFFYPYGAGSYVEYPLYDLSMEVGDTFSISINYQNYTADSVYTDNLGRKCVRLTYNYITYVSADYPRNTGNLTFIEGVGTSYGFTYNSEISNWFPLQHETPYLLCNKKDGNDNYYHNNPDPFFTGCYMSDTIVGVRDLKRTDISVYPNPATDYINVSSKNQVQPVVFGIDSRQVSVPVKKEGDIYILDIRNLKQGMYLIQSGNGTGKFLKQNNQ